MIEFGMADGMNWNPASMEIRFTVHVNGTPVICRVSYEAIADHYGAQREHECLALARQHFDAISDEIGHLIATRRFEPDGSVLLRTRDW